jgi:hypothetical protein
LPQRFSGKDINFIRIQEHLGRYFGRVNSIHSLVAALW